MVDTKSKEIWSQMGYDTSVFDGPEIDDKDLSKNDSWIKAAREVYEMSHGEAPPASMSRQALSDWADNYVDQYNGNSAQFAVRTAKVMGASAEQKSAFLYLLDLNDHTTISRGDVWNTAKAMATDPLTYLGIGTLGVGLAVKKGGQVAATTAGKAALRQSIMASLKTTVLTGAVEGSLSASTRNAADQSIRISAGHQSRFDPLGFATSTAMGAGFGGAFGGVFGAAVPAIGSLTSKISPKVNDVARTVFTESRINIGSRSVFNPVGSSARFIFNTAVKPLDDKTSNLWARVSGRSQGTAGTGNTASATAQAAPSANAGSAASAAAAKVSKGVKYTADGLPIFDPGIDKLKVLTHLSANPFTGFIKWFSVKSQRIDSRPVTRPVIDFTDSALAKNGLGEKIRKLNDDAIRAFEGRKDPQAVMDAFANDAQNVKAIGELHTELQKLKTHVVNTYETNDVSTWKNGLNQRQKEALIKYIDDLDEKTQDLLNGSGGEVGKEMMANLQRIYDGNLSLKDVKNSITGLSSISHMANTAHIRNTGTWPLDGKAATIQIMRGLERSIDVGFYSKHMPQKPITYNFLANDNTEQIWQNRFMDMYPKRNENGKLEQDFTGNVKAPQAFAATNVELVNRGYAHDSLMGLDFLKRMRQHIGGDDLDTTPPVEDFKLAVANMKRDNDPYLQDWLKRAEEILEDDVRGRHHVLPWMRIHEDSRANRHLAASRLYVWDYNERYAGTVKPGGFYMSKPGQMYFTDRFLKTPAQRLGAFLVGAKQYQLGVDKMFGSTIKDHRNFKMNWKADDETIAAPLRRMALRLSSGGLIDDISFSAKMIPTGIKTTSFGKAAMAGSTVMGLGVAGDYFLNEGETSFLGGTAQWAGEGVMDAAMLPADLITGMTWDQIPYLPDMPISTIRGSNSNAENDNEATGNESPETNEEDNIPFLADKSGTGPQQPQGGSNTPAAPNPATGSRVTERQIVNTAEQIIVSSGALNQATVALRQAEVASRMDPQNEAKKQAVETAETKISDTQNQIEALRDQYDAQAIAFLTQDMDGLKSGASLEQQTHYLRTQSVLETIAKNYPQQDLLQKDEAGNYVYFALADQMAQNRELFDNEDKLTSGVLGFGGKGANALKQAMQTGVVPAAGAAAAGTAAAQPQGGQGSGGSAPAPGQDDTLADDVLAVDTTNTNQTPVGGAAEAPASGDTPSAKSAADNAFASDKSMGEHLGDLGNSVGQAATSSYTFDGDMPDGLRSTFGAVGGFLSGAGRVIGNFAGDLFNEKISGGRWWIGAGVGLVGALMAGSLAKKIPVLGKIPFIGLVAAFFAFPWIMKGTKGVLDSSAGTAQGGGTYIPPVAAATVGSRIDPQGNVSHGAQGLQIPMDDGSMLELADNDNDGHFAVQISNNNGGQSHADFTMLTGDAAVQASQGNNVIHVPAPMWQNKAVKLESNTYDAQAHQHDPAADNDNGMIVLKSTGTGPTIVVSPAPQRPGLDME